MRGSVDSNMTSTCIQGGFSRPFGGYQPSFIMEPHSAAPAWQMQHSIVPKQEPIDEDRNDSGINSGSDVHSPGSETGQDFHRTALYTHLHNQQDSSISTYYSNPLMPRISTAPLDYNPANHNNSEFNNAEVPQPSNQDSIKNESKPENMQTDNAENEDPLRRLESALENNRLLQFPQPSSPRVSEHSGNKSDDGEPDSDLSIRVPRMNSHGKMKSYKCKQCNYLCYTKLEFWEHSKTHIKEGKMLTCTKCPFVTEYKHHLEYHMRNHTGSKPYKCSRCNYSCVNKSMLNSHLKSHSNVYQYRCSNCTYVSKYCHSLKLHLRKYDHQPAMVLNPDGTPNPYPIVDVYGTRRGPKQKHASKHERPKSPTNNLQTQFAQFLSNPVPQIPLPLPYHLLGELQARLQTSMMYSAANVENFSKVLQPSGSPEPEKPTMDCSFPPPPNSESQESQQALDLRKPDPNPAKPNPPKNRRKGQAFKLGNFPINDTSDDEDDVSNIFSKPVEKPSEDKVVNNNNNNNNNDDDDDDNKKFSCQFCNILYGDIIMYTMHMGYHGFKDPFTCNMCGEQCKDSVSFFVHIARTPHK